MPVGVPTEQSVISWFLGPDFCSQEHILPYMVLAFPEGDYKALVLDGHPCIQQLPSSSASSVRNSLGRDVVRLTLKHSRRLNGTAGYKLFS